MTRISPAGAQTHQQLDWCVNHNAAYSPELRIKGCTAAINSGKWRSKALEWAFANRCIAYKDRGDLDHAIADCQRAIALDPGQALPHAARGEVFHLKGDYDRAIADYNEAIRLAPNDATTYNNRGEVSRAKGDYAAAITDYNRAIRLNPKFAAPYNNRGLAYDAKG